MSIQDKLASAKRSDMFDNIPEWQIRIIVRVAKLKAKIFRMFQRLRRSKYIEIK